MNTVRIINEKYLDANGDEYVIGGVETYIRNLIELFLDMNFEVFVYQYANKAFSIKRDGAKIVAIEKRKSKIKSYNMKRLVKEASKDADFENDILIFATDFSVVKSRFKKVLTIQHGIAWDIQKTENVKDITNRLSIIKGAIRANYKYTRFKKCQYIVCVDYNFMNWYKTQVLHINSQMRVIPNFADAPSNYIKKPDSNVVSIVFARRLVEYRGTRIFVNAIKPLLKKYNNLYICIAGTGPEEKWMKEQLKSFSNVVFSQYSAKESINFHTKFDIAVVPTRGSEGTSLSLLEAMSAGCAVVATQVGGMTNIILNNYNGYLVEPNFEDVMEAIEKLIKDKEHRNVMAKRGYDTVISSFSLSQWKEKWKKLILEIIG